MAPRTIFLLTLAGVLLAGAPLPWLTRVASPAASAPSETAPAAQTELIYATVRFTGKPLNLRLRQGNQEWVADTTQMPAELELETAATSPLELEVLAEWEDASPQAVTLELEPEGRESRTETHWKPEGSTQLHSLFTFTW